MRPPRHDVATSVLANALDAVEGLGWPFQPDWAGAGFDPERLRSEGGFVSWEEYLAFLEALAGPGAGPEDHARAGSRIMDWSVGGPVRHLGRLVDGAGPLFRLVYGSILGSTVPVVRSSVEAVGPRRLRVRLVLGPELAPGDVFFHSVLGTMRRLPTLVGSPEARVEARIGSHEAEYDVQLLPGGSLAARVGRAWRVLRGRGEEASSEELLLRVDAAVRDLRAAEAKLGEAEARWRELASGVPGLVVVTDADGVVLEAHGSAPRPAGLAIGRPWAEVFVPEDRAVVAEQLARPRAEPVEARAATSAGEAWWSCRAAALTGDPLRRVVVAHDVTGHRRAEEALREAERRYLHAQKLEAIARLAGGLAHDINNVLTAILAHADLLESALGPLSSRARAPIDGVRDAVGRASALTRRLLAAGRPRASGSKVADLSGLCRDARGVLSRLVGEAITLRVEVPDAPVPVGVEEDRVEQMLLNLVVNARDALPDGGTILVRVEAGARHGTLEVIDDGTGMSEEVLARATEPFFTTKPAGLGSGLGLSTVRDLVTDAGGELHLRSAPGHGTTIRIALPLAVEVRPVDRPAAQPDGRVDGGGRSVLLVEDQDDVRELVAENLARIGFRVTPCPGGEAALRAFRSDPAGFDLLVTDVVMPGLGGVDLSQAVRALRPDLPILLMSGYAETDGSGLAGTGRVRFLAKPFKVAGLASAVRTLLP